MTHIKKIVLHTPKTLLSFHRIPAIVEATALPPWFPARAKSLCRFMLSGAADILQVGIVQTAFFIHFKRWLVASAATLARATSEFFIQIIAVVYCYQIVIFANHTMMAIAR